MAISQIVQNSLANTISLGPKITSVQVANSSYTVLDDTSINIGGGYIVITGSGFQSNCSVIVDSNLACSVAFVSATQVRAQLPAKSAGTYNIYLLNGDGGTAIRVNALQYSNTPTWVTTSPLSNIEEDSTISVQLSATGANTYSLQTGSTLPTGLTLSANGLISGVVNTNASIDTTYNFTVEAIDTELQETPKAFSVTVTVGDPNFYRTFLILDGNGTAGGNNNTFTDSSNNGFAITKVGNTLQGSFSPFSPVGWSTYFDGAQDYIQYSANTATQFGTGDYTIEFWLNMPRGVSVSNATGFWRAVLCTNGDSTLGNTSVTMYVADGGSGSTVAGEIVFMPNTLDASRIYGGVDLRDGQWHHIAATRTSGFCRLYVDGSYIGGKTITTNLTSATPTLIGSSAPSQNSGNGNSIPGHLSNVRLIKGTSLYTANSSITVPTAALTAVSGTSLLTCNANRHRDTSSNNLAIDFVTGTPQITTFSPFNSGVSYSPSLHGGSSYYDGTGTDRLTIADNDTAFSFGSGNYTMEAWVYPMSAGTTNGPILNQSTSGAASDSAFFVSCQTDGAAHFVTDGTGWDYNATNSSLYLGYQWNHVAWVRNGAIIYVYVNGVQQASATVGAGFVLGNSSRVIEFGSQNGSSNFAGYIGPTRITKGTALYTGNFTPPTAPFDTSGGPSLVVNFASANITDYTEKNTIQTIGNVTVNTAVKKSGTGSISIPGSTSYLNALTSLGFGNIFNIRSATQSFTFEAWIYPTTINSSGPQDFRFTSIISKGIVYLSFGFTSTGILRFYMYNGSENYISSSSGIVTTNTWQHVAVSSNAGTVRLFHNGTQVASGSLIVPNSAMSDQPKIGHADTSFSSDQFVGLIDNIRYTEGVARYTSAFTPADTWPTK